jgi:protoheme IX farnesyltransferase
MPRGEVQSIETILVSGAFWGGAGLSLLYAQVNPLTMWLTLATFVGYAVIYTVFLKPNTSQNIVIGGASGAMPPVLGWAAVTNTTPPEAWMLFLIIFVWTPPHFWTLALYRAKEYAAAGIPMLPVTHGVDTPAATCFFYTVGLTIITLVPAAINMTELVLPRIRGDSRRCLSGVFVAGVASVQRQDRAKILQMVDHAYLSLLFAALLIDHYMQAYFA